METGIKTYNNLQIDPKQFGAVIVADVSEVQYWRDRPLFLKKIDGWFSDAVAWNDQKFDQYIDQPIVNEYLVKMQEVADGISGFETESDRIQNIIKSYSYINENTPDIDYPDNPVQEQDIILYDEDGNPQDTFTTDINTRETKDTPNGPQNITILDSLPDDYDDDLIPENIDQATITTLPDSFIKSKIWASGTEVPKLNDDLNEATSLFMDPIQEASNITTYEQPDLSMLNQEIGTPKSIFYGIPLISLSPVGTPLEDSVIVHINTSRGHRLDITGISTSGTEAGEIMIDRIIPPETKFTAGVLVAWNSISLFLKIQGDPELYTSRVSLPEELFLTLSGFGADLDDTKSLCGHIYDIIQIDSNDFNADPDINVPLIPGPAISYPFSTGLVRGENTYSTREGEVSSRNGGGWLQLDPDWMAVYNGYLDRFFCRHEFNSTDFTITWFQYQLGYPPGIRTFISDNINDNYIYLINIYFDQFFKNLF